MEFNCTISFKTNSSRGGGDGTVLFDDGYFIIYNKGIAARAMFGAIGAALAKGKEVMRFDVSEIESYRSYRRLFSNYITLTLNDGSTLTFNYPKKVQNELLPILAVAPQEA